MKTLPVAPPVARGPGVAVLQFLRDSLDRLALWRLTERDPAVAELLAEVADDLVSRSALLARKMRRLGLLDGSEKITGLRSVDNRDNNRQQPESR